jgi:hypothetical protein
MYVHARILMMTVDNWGNYIEHLHSQLKEIVNHLVTCSLGTYPLTRHRKLRPA